MRLKGKNVLVTGGARRVGRSIALAFAARGANVIIHCRHSVAEAKSLADEIRALGVGAWMVRADLSRPKEIHRLLGWIRRKKIPVDVLINNASFFARTPWKTVRWKDWDRFFEIHVKAPFALALGLFGGHRRLEGRIINIIDEGLRNSDPDYLPYGASKAALSFLTRGLAKALAPKILVTAVSPGLVLPPENLSPAAKKRVAKEVGRGKWGLPEDVARLAVRLAVSSKTGIERDV